MRISDWSSDVCSSDLPQQPTPTRTEVADAWPQRRAGQRCDGQCRDPEQARRPLGQERQTQRAPQQQGLAQRPAVIEQRGNESQRGQGLEQGQPGGGSDPERTPQRPCPPCVKKPP